MNYEKRVIPVLLLKDNELSKSVRFKKFKYIGDPINAVRIFNEKEVDELVVIDTDSSKKNSKPNFYLLERIAREAFMPMAYGGGLNNLDDVRRIIKLGYEKVIINSFALKKPEFIKEISRVSGSQSTLVCVDIKKNFFGKYSIYDHSKGVLVKKDLKNHIDQMIDNGAGEIIINSVDKDGTYEGYDLELLKNYGMDLAVPLIACGGAGSMEDVKEVLDNDYVSAAAAGSIFVFHGPHRAVLINYYRV
jgi:imidazole glycerol-phosphate synthase subunit HisF